MSIEAREAPEQNSGSEIAIIGMAGRWPGAHTPDLFWRNIREGIDSISRLSIDEIEDPCVDALAGRANYIRARSVVDGVEDFDPGFFGVLPKDARVLDPQHRVFLECCWEALEDAGYVPENYPGSIGVIAGSAVPTYFLQNLCTDRAFIEKFTSVYPLDGFSVALGTIGDTLTTRVAYKLNLRGPSFTLLSACSTSLVAVSQACQSLLTWQSDMMLAGGVAISFPQKRGYLYQEGAMGSADGYCRPFEASANGTVFGSGAGVVLLKRLGDALADGDHIYAVIKGFAVNNDGATKVGFTAPSVEGQAQVILAAQELAGVDPATIGYLEGHGTATPLGDPIEVTALTRAFRAGTQARQFCALGSVKRNIGHLEMAAGVSGLICATQALAHRQIPPSHGFDKPNPNLNLEESPFYINTDVADWPAGETPRRAGVSSFGVGGTNAHVVLEEAPPAPPQESRSGHLLVLSARSDAALEHATNNLLAHLKANPDRDMDSAAWTLQSGRRRFSHRRVLACTDALDAIRALEARDRSRVQTLSRSGDPPTVVFMFPGQGSQYPRMGAGLYAWDAEFRADVDRCAEILQPWLGLDLREVIAAPDGAQDLSQTRLTQPALFVLSYATARLWERWGVTPQAMVGHSVGEFVAACLSGVFSLEDALAIVATRGRMAQDARPGAMLSVRLGHRDVLPWITEGLSLAAVNAPQLSVVAGEFDAVEALERKLGEARVMAMRLKTSHAFHSAMMDPVVEPFTDFLSGIPLNPPTRPFLSSVTGDWIRPEQVTDPLYWARHMREPVLFSDCIQLLRSEPGRILLETGPGDVLCKLAAPHRDAAGAPAVASLPNTSADDQSDVLNVLRAAGTLWLHGVDLDWKRMHAADVRRCSLPTYPFERQRCWVDPPARSGDVSVSASEPQNNKEQGIDAPQIAMPETQSIPSRAERLRSPIVDILENLSGMNLSGCDADASFLELGFDSLFLTQVTQELQGKFGVSVTFRQLLNEESTVPALAAYIDAHLPADAFPAEPAAVPVAAPLEAAASAVQTPTAAIASPAACSVPAVHGGVESILREQLNAMSQLMARQLDVLRGSAMPVPAAAAPALELAPTTPPPVVAAAAAPSPRAAAPPLQNSTDFKAHGRFKPIQRGPLGGLTERQKGHLDALIRLYTSRTPRSKELAQKHRGVLADPRGAAGFRSQWKEMVYPIVTVSSQGSKLRDIDGNEYIDLVNGFGPIFFGHAPDFVVEAVDAQLKNGFETGPQSPLAGECAELFHDLTGNERMTFCNTGSEAVMAALRLSRTVTGRKKVVVFNGSYHGTFDEVLVKGILRDGVPHSLPVAPGVCNEHVANLVVLEYGTPEALEYIRRNARDLAAVLCETIQSRHPSFHPVEFLREVRRITEESGTALIFDEVVTGFRVHPGGVQALFGIRADLATYGKVVGGGMPVGILGGRARFMDALDGGAWQYGDDSYPEVGVTFFAGTFVRHPIALAATKAVLQRLKEAGPELQQNLNARMTSLAARVNGIFEECGVPAHADQFSSWFYFTFPPDQPYASLLQYHMRTKGVYVMEGFPCFLTTAHSDADIETIVRAFRESAAELQAAGFLPEPERAPVLAAAAPLPAEVPLTEPQREILLSARLGDDINCAFNEAFALHLRGPLNRSALVESLQALIDRHDSLRATIDFEREVLHVRDAVPLNLRTIDLSNLNEAERAAELQSLISTDAAQPFDLTEGPLFRMQLVTMEREHHVLLFTGHHIVCDGWSSNVLLSDLAALYAASGNSTALPPPQSFRTFALDQRRWTESAERATVEQWWVEKFSTPVTPLDLPVDRPRAAVKWFHGDTARRIVGPAAYQRIKKFGAKQGCTLFVTLLAGFKTLMHRLSGQDDIVVGIPVAGQSLLQDGSLVGHCVNFLPLRSSFEGDPTAATLLKQVRSTLLDAYDHQNYTFGSLVQKLGIRRDPSRVPLVEIQFNLEKVGTGLEFPGLKAQVDPSPKRFVNFDLFLNIVESEDGLTMDCDYNTDLFDRETVLRWLGHFETLLESMATDVAQPVSAVSLLTGAERHELTEGWNDTRREFPRGLCVHQLIEAQTARTPNAVALVCGDQRLTYSEVDSKANRLAHALKQRGVDVRDRVGVCLNRSVEMVLAVLGVMKAGAAYIPLDPEFPRERIALVLEDSAPALLITEREVAQRLQLPPEKVLCLDDIEAELSAAPAHAPSTAVSADDSAYVIYTSGSTGKPKGVEIVHRAVVNFLASMAHEPGFTASDTLLAVTTLSFDIAVLELYLPLTVGGRVVVARREDTRDGNLLLDLLNSSGATVMQATPATWRLLLEAGWNGPRNLKVLCGGEPLPRDLADALLARCSSLWNMYGPTETTVWSAVSRVERGSEPVRVGPPIANTEFYVVDAKGQPVPLGVAGELLIGGDGLARGYWNRPDLTAEKFLPDTFRPGPGRRLYKTGDLVRPRADGTLEFLGRNDNQVKIRGFRIETGDIEHALKRFPGIRDCVVVARDDDHGEKQLIAYYVANEPLPSSRDLRLHVSGLLPAYMTPAAFIPLSAMPRTPNGKLDRKALPAPLTADTAELRARLLPRTPLEEKLVEICSNVLKHKQIYVDDNLFDLGADSLRLFQIVVRAKDAGFNLSVKEILVGQTIAAIAEEMSRISPSAETQEPVLTSVSREKYRIRRTIVRGMDE